MKTTGPRSLLVPRLAAAFGCAFASASCISPSTVALTLGIHPGSIVYSSLQSTDGIQADILKHTPVGSSPDEVFDFINLKLYLAGPRTFSLSTRDGVLSQDGDGRFIGPIGSRRVSAIEVSLRESSPVWHGDDSLACIWRFSEEGKLIGVEVRRFREDVIAQPMADEPPTPPSPVPPLPLLPEPEPWRHEGMIQQDR
jgi:hypothetical protein